MSANPDDVFAALRTGGDTAPTEQPKPSAFSDPGGIDPNDAFAAIKISDPQAPRINSRENTLGEEFAAGLGGGIDGMQAGLYGVAGLAGRELGIGWLEEAGNAGAQRNAEEGANATRQAGGFTDIESAGGFFKWAAASLGEAIPSLAAASTGAGIGMTIGRKAIELAVKKSLARSVERRMAARYGFSREESLLAARDYMTSSTGQTALARAMTGERTGAIIGKAVERAQTTGGLAGGAAVAGLPITGQIDQELIERGVTDPGLIALFGGVAGGALEAIPAVKLIKRLMPGVSVTVGKTFVRDFAAATGSQAALEGGTEAAQEIITLAALAYKDPSFDMFSPDAKRRVVDAFAAGALVGAVTGGGAHAIGGSQEQARAGVKKAAPVIGAWSMTAKDKATDLADKAREKFGSEEIDIEGGLPTEAEEAEFGFVPADNTLFEEIKGRVYATVQPHIEAAVNSLQAQMDKTTQDLNDNLEGGVNAESATISQLAKAAHNKFIDDHGDRIDRAKTFLNEQTARITEAAKAIKDPAKRDAYIEGETAKVKAKLSTLVEYIRREAAKRNQKVEAEVDNMDLDDGMLEELGFEIEQLASSSLNEETERRVGPSGRKFDRPVGEAPEAEETFAPKNVANPGDTEVAPIMTFGRNQLAPTVGVDGKEDAVPYPTKADAQKGRAKLRKRFPEVQRQDDAFRIVRHKSGKGWMIEVISPEVKESQKFFEDLKQAESSAKRRRDNDRKVILKDFDGEKFGFRDDKKSLELDVQTMAYKGKNVDKNAQTDMEGFLAFAGEMMSRGMINEAQFNELLAKAEPLFAKNEANETQSFNDRVVEIRQKEAAETRKGFAQPQTFTESGAAWGALNEFKEEMDLQGVPYPFADKEDGASWSKGKEGNPTGFSQGARLFTVTKNEDGSWSWGFDRSKKAAPRFKALRLKDPQVVAAIMDAVHNRRRSEALDTANREAGDFSGNPEASGTSALRQGETPPAVRAAQRARGSVSSPGDLGDTTGATAGSARIRSDAVRGERTDADGNLVEGRDARAQEQDGDPAGQNLTPEGGQQDFATQTGGFGVRPDNNVNQRESRTLDDTDPQADDRLTDPDELPSEFQDRKEELKRTSSRKNKTTAKNAKNPQTERDNRLLKRWGRPGSVKMMLGGATAANVQEALTKLANFVTKTLGLSNQVIVMDDAGLALMIEQGLVTDPIFEQTLNDPNVHARNIRIGDNSFVYLSPKILSDPTATVLAFGHEMGHHVYRVAWDSLTPEAQARLRKASNTKTDSEFNEWMADQLAAWIVQPRIPVGPAQAFFAKVSAKIRKLYDFISKNERFQLNETFKEFADAVALQARTTADAGSNPLGDAQLKAWFRNEGVTMYGWFGASIQAKDKGPKKTKKAGFEPHSIADRADMINRRELEMENLWEEQDSENQTPARVREIRNRLAELEGEIDEIANEIAAQRATQQAEAKAAARAARTARAGGAEVDNMAYDFAPVTQQSKDALAKVEKNYPALVKRAILIRNWMKAAYSMILAPSTSTLRTIAKRGITSAETLALMFHRGKMGEAKGKQNYHQAVELMRAQFMDQLTTITKRVEAAIEKTRPGIKNSEKQTLLNAHMRKLGKSLQSKDGDKNATFTKEEQTLRDLFDNMHDYAREAGLPVRKVTNYFPRALSRDLLVANKQKILDHLTDGIGMPLEKARSLYNSLIDPNANDGRATQDATETPGFKAMNSRAVQDKFFDQFLDDNTQAIIGNYVNQVVKRAEFNRLLGEPMPATHLNAKQAIKEGVWDPKAGMHKLLAAAKKEGATDEELVTMERYIDANLGQLGRDMNPTARKVMAGIMAYQNMRVLMFTVFASLPDMAGPAIRSGSMKGAFKSVKDHIGEIASNESKLAETARALGVIQDAMSDHIMTEYVDNHYMPPKLRKWNDAFFKWTGLNYYTDFTRKAALAVGIDYLSNSYEQFKSADPKTSARGKDMLAELGVTPAMIAKWQKDGKPTYDSQSDSMDSANRKVAEALIQFVDESIMRPNASQRPILASHPAAMLMYHLKGYMYAVNDIILKRIKFNIDEADSPAQYTAAIAPALLMMLMTAVGLELREIIQYAGSNRKPPTDRMDGWEYTWELAQRSGLTGFAQIGIDFQGAEDRGMSHVAGIMGPALSQAADIMSKPKTQTIPKAIPVIGQIPALREGVRNVIN